MNPSISTFFAVLLPCLACLGAYIVYTSRPDLFLAEPRRTIERLSRCIYLSSPSDADMAKAFRLVEFVASSGQDVSRAASDARAMLKRRIALVDGWIDRLGRFSGKDVDPAPLGYMRDLPTGTTPHDIVSRTRHGFRPARYRMKRPRRSNRPVSRSRRVSIRPPRWWRRGQI